MFPSPLFDAHTDDNQEVGLFSSLFCGAGAAEVVGVDFKSTTSYKCPIGTCMSFGRKLRGLRKAAGMTLRQLAEKAGLDFTYLSKIETGKLQYMPASDTIRKLADLLGADPLELLSLADKLPPELDQISDVPAARRFIERAQRVASPQDWEALLDVLEKRHADRERGRKGDRP